MKDFDSKCQGAVFSIRPEVEQGSNQCLLHADAKTCSKQAHNGAHDGPNMWPIIGPNHEAHNGSHTGANMDPL
jgi:hypothetical protein